MDMFMQASRVRVEFRKHGRAAIVTDAGDMLGSGECIEHFDTARTLRLGPISFPSHTRLGTTWTVRGPDEQISWEVTQVGSEGSRGGTEYTARSAFGDVIGTYRGRVFYAADGRELARIVRRGIVDPDTGDYLGDVRSKFWRGPSRYEITFAPAADEAMRKLIVLRAYMVWRSTIEDTSG